MSLEHVSMQSLRLSALALASAVIGAGTILAYGVMWPAASGLSCRAEAASMARLELLFGAGTADGKGVSEAEWTAFLASEVTPRFPDGLTVFTGHGQWREGAGPVVAEASRMLLIWYRPGLDSERRIEAIRAAYKSRFGQKSVMRVDERSCVSF
jgi:hypothetical protein